MSLKRSHTVRTSHKKFGFKPNEFIPLEDREYGLIRTSGDRASTPHPKKWKTNLNALNARLEEMKSRHRSNQSDEIDKNVAHLKSDVFSSPRKRSMENEVGGISASMPFSADKKGSTKKVMLLSPRKSDNISFKRMSAQADLLSFSERRRLFHEGEFTIAKHGKKMNDTFIGIHDENTCDDLSELDEYATLQLETLTAEHGLIQGALGVLTIDGSIKSSNNAYEI